MATTPRQRNPRTVRIFDTQADRDDDVAVALPAATLYSRPINASLDGNNGLHLIWTAGPTGTFTVQGTLKGNPELTTDADWVTLAPTVTGTALAVAGAAGNTILNVSGMFEFIRVKWAYTSGAAATVIGWAQIGKNSVI